jgi:hypothetical protein
MVAVDVMVVPPRNSGDGNQLTWVNGTEIVTVTGFPFAAELGGSGVTEIVAV